VTAREDAHIAGCEACSRAVDEPARPFDEDLCHMNIAPGDGWDDAPVIQCPHLAVPGGRTPICARHLDDAHEAYARLVSRTAPLN